MSFLHITHRQRWQSASNKHSHHQIGPHRLRVSTHFVARSLSTTAMPYGAERKVQLTRLLVEASYMDEGGHCTEIALRDVTNDD